MEILIAFILSALSFFGFGAENPSDDFTPNSGAFAHIVCDDDMPMDEIWMGILSGECRMR